MPYVDPNLVFLLVVLLVYAWGAWVLWRLVQQELEKDRRRRLMRELDEAWKKERIERLWQYPEGSTQPKGEGRKDE